ncbi:hypothetical protein [Bacillus paramycoides]|uniref:hypothetical protein n=1 Tax=Bacillus paramycoides TaxID=2026194 RepID=UPI00381FCC12
MTVIIDNSDYEIKMNRLVDHYNKAVSKYSRAVEGMKNWTPEFDATIYSVTCECSDSLFSGIEIALRIFLETKEESSTNNLATLCNVAGQYPEMNNIELNCFVENKEPRNQTTHNGRLVELSDYTRVIENFKRLIFVLNPDVKLSTNTFEVENVFNFNEFYEAIGQFELKNCKYMLICNPMHDVRTEYLDLLAKINWDIIINLDSRETEGSLTNQLNDMGNVITYDIKNLRTSGINETMFKINKTVQLLTEEKAIPKRLQDWGRLFKNNLEYFVETSYSIETPKLAIVCLKESDAVLNLILEKFIDTYGQDNVYINFLSGNYSSEKVKELDERYSNYKTFNGSIPQILSSFNDYSHVLPSKEELMSYEHIVLPGRSGEKIPLKNVNLLDNLNMYFEIVDLSKGKNADLACNEEEFLKGNVATWEILNAQYDVLMVENKRYKDFKNEVKSALGTKDYEEKLFYIEHNPGFGGTTLSRRLAWDIHEDNPVLMMKRYDNISTIPLIQRLYDDVKNGILIVVDENIISRNDIEKFENAIKNIDRPVAAIIVKRSRNNNEEKKHILKLNLINKNSLNQFIFRCKSLAYRKFSKNVVDEREAKMKQVLNGDMLCPLMIGLYFLEKEFIGIEEYVGRFINNLKDGVLHDNLKTAMKFIALCDYFGQKSVYSSLIEKIFNTALLPSNRFDLEEELKEVKDLFIFEIKNRKVQSVKARHYLISLEIMRQLFPDSSMQYHKETWKDYLYQHSKEMIDLLLSLLTNKLDDELRNLITDIFIDNRNESPDSTEELDGDFALLIETIPANEQKAQLLEYLTHNFNNYIINNLDPETSFKEYQMLAHIWGHLARYYSKKGLNNNHEKAEECCKKALVILDQIDSYDYIIYHIYADCLYRNAKNIYNNLTIDDIDTEQWYELKGLIDSAVDYYEKTITYGNFEYGTTSQLKLLVDFMRVVFNIYQFESIADIKKIKDKWLIGYLSKIGDLIENVDYLQFNPKAKNIFTRWKSQFESISYQKNVSQIIMDLNNYLDELNNQLIKDSESIRHTRKALINSLLKKYEHDLTQLAKPENARNLNRIMDLIKQNIQMPNKYSRYDYALWFKIAHYSDIPISEAIIMARNWHKLLNEHNHSDPMPSYYLYVLHYLRALEGYNEALNEAKKYQKECMQICTDKKKFEVINENKVRDWFGNGKGISKIIDDRTVDYTKILDDDRLFLAEGRFIEMDKEGKGIYGYLEITNPIKLKGEKVFFRPIECGITSLQIRHAFKFKFGFSFERLVAFNNSIESKDKTKAKQETSNVTVENLRSNEVLKRGDIVDFNIKFYLDKTRLLVGDIVGSNYSGGIIHHEVSDEKLTDQDLRAYVNREVKAVIVEFDEEKQKYRLSIKKYSQANGEAQLDDDLTTLGEKLKQAFNK